jgi:uncharacterized phage infection (PIP) family protein YhgE
MNLEQLKQKLELKEREIETLRQRAESALALVSVESIKDAVVEQNKSIAQLALELKQNHEEYKKSVAEYGEIINTALDKENNDLVELLSNINEGVRDKPKQKDYKKELDKLDKSVEDMSKGITNALGKIKQALETREEIPISEEFIYADNGRGNLNKVITKYEGFTITEVWEWSGYGNVEKVIYELS